MTATLGDRIHEARTRAFGRDELVASLVELPAEDAPLVVHVHGVAGIGKTTLLEIVAEQAAAAAINVVSVREMSSEPTDLAFLDLIARGSGLTFDSDLPLTDQLAALPAPTLVVVDEFESLRLLETWFRQIFVPALPTHARVILASRYPPSPAWTRSMPGPELFRSIELGPLDAPSARALLAESGVDGATAARVNGVVNGHPLALTLAAALLQSSPKTSVEDAATEGILAALGATYVQYLRDPLTRQAIEAAAVTRRTTRSILEAQLGRADSARAYNRLEALPLVRQHSDGLSLHDSVRQAISSELASRDPVRHRALRRAAWRELARELREAGDHDLWRYTSDILYLLQNPLLREGYFPSGPPALSIEPAFPADHQAIRAIARRHDGPEATAILDAWIGHQPSALSVVRDGSGEVIAFRCAAVSSELSPSVIRADPVIRAWLTELSDESHEELDGYFVRRWLTRDEGEGPSAAQGLCWIDCKRWYFRLRGKLGSVFIAMRDIEQYEPALAALGFRRVAHAEVGLDGERCVSVVQDFGPGGVDGWYARLVGVELGLDAADFLDEANHDLLIDGDRIHLTPLEFGVMQQLVMHRDAPVTHADLVENVWGYRYTRESNVDAVVVRGIRSKLGVRASMIETIRGVGYRLNVG